jgi:hypothetical protein
VTTENVMARTRLGIGNTYVDVSSGNSRRTRRVTLLHELWRTCGRAGGVPARHNLRNAFTACEGRDIGSVEPSLVARNILGNSLRQQLETQEGYCALDIGPSALPYVFIGARMYASAGRLAEI